MRALRRFGSSFLSPSPRPRLTICIPAYRSAPFIDRCLASVSAQTFRDSRVVISNDGGHDRAEVDRAAARLGALVHHGRRRLGWVGNVNRLISGVETELFCILPQDDEIAPDYFERLITLIDENPSCCAAFSDLEIVGYPGASGTVLPATPVEGRLVDRIRNTLLTQYNGYSFRAVVRTQRPARRLRLIDNPDFSFAADTTWIMQKAVLGDLLRYPAPLYRKIYHPENTHSSWELEPTDRIARAWLTHCRDMTATALPFARSSAEAEAFRGWGETRLLSPFASNNVPFPDYVTTATQAEWRDAAAAKAAFATLLERVI